MYVDKTKKSRDIIRKRHIKIRNKREKMILYHISKHPNQTTYSLQKHFKYPLRSIQRIINKLIIENKIKITIEIDNNRLRKIIIRK